MINYSAVTSARTPYCTKTASEHRSYPYVQDYLECADRVKAKPEWMYVNKDKIERNIGWKIHVSATLASSHQVSDSVSAIGQDTQTPYNHIPMKSAFRDRNAKYAELGSAGKLITIYPSVDTFDPVRDRIATTPQGYPGSGISMDIPHGDAPVHYRYSQFIDTSRADKWGTATRGDFNPNGTWARDDRVFLENNQVDDYWPKM